MTAHGFHTEIYETAEELRGPAGRPCYPAQGAVLMSDDDRTDLAAMLSGMREAGCFLPVIAFTAGTPRPRQIVSALRAGAVDYLCFPDDMAIVGSTVDAVIEHAASLARHYEMTALARTRIARLSRQERRVLESVIAGATSKETARQMGLSNRTVEVHRAAVLHKLEVATSAGAIAMGIAAGIMATIEDPAAKEPSEGKLPQLAARRIGFDLPFPVHFPQGRGTSIDPEMYRKAG